MTMHSANKSARWLPIGLSMISMTGVPTLASTFDALCPSQECQVTLSRTGLAVGKVKIELKNINYWNSELNEASPSSASGKARGAVIGGIAGAALLGPVGAAIGAVWAGSEESAGRVQSDNVFIVEGKDSDGKILNIKIRFLNQTSARRFRMELPMFAGIRAGRRRPTMSSIPSTQKEKNQNCWSDFKRLNSDMASWIESNPTISKKQRNAFNDC